MKKKILIFYSFLFIINNKSILANNTISKTQEEKTQEEKTQEEKTQEKKIEFDDVRESKNNSFFAMLANMIKKLFGIKEIRLNEELLLEEIRKNKNYNSTDLIHYLEKELNKNKKLLKNHTSIEIRLKLYAMSDYLENVFNEKNRTEDVINKEELSKSINNANKFFELYQKAYSLAKVNSGDHYFDYRNHYPDFFYKRPSKYYFDILEKESKKNTEIDINILKNLFIDERKIYKDDFFKDNFTPTKNASHDISDLHFKAYQKSKNLLETNDTINKNFLNNNHTNTINENSPHNEINKSPIEKENPFK